MEAMTSGHGAMRHLDVLVYRNGLLAALLCAGFIFGLGWTGWVLNPLGLARARAERSVDDAAARLEAEFAQAEGTAGGLDALWKSGPGGDLGPSRLSAIQPFLDHSTLPLNLILYRADRDSLLILNSARNSERIIVPGPKGTSSLLRGPQGQWIPVNPDPMNEFRTQDRPWFHLAKATQEPAWTSAYRFTSRSSGFTFIIPERTKGRLAGVVGVDLTLEQLERRVRETLPPSEFKVLLTDRAGRVLVPPEPGPQTAEAREGRLLGSPDPETLHALCAKGPFRFQRRVTLRTAGPTMTLSAAATPETLLPHLRLRIAMVALAALVTFAAIMYYAYNLNRNLVRPIRRLLQKQSEGTPKPDTSSSEIWEFRQLEDSIRRLGQTESDRQQILNQLEHAQRVATMGIMAPGVIHDLNNHLSVILAQLELCLEEPGIPPRVHTRITKAETATMRCSEAMRGLLEFSRPGPPRPVACDLNDLVVSAVSLLEPVLGENIRVDKDLAKDLPQLEAEPIKLQQVIVNLALNAKDAMRGVGALTFRTGLEGQDIALEIQDTGSGMTEEVKRKLFEPFFTTKPQGKGTGLGLTMVNRIVSAHGGTVRVESEPGQGTRFIILLPPMTGGPCPELLELGAEAAI
jgi:signal transduction histidine kinase